MPLFARLSAEFIPAIPPPMTIAFGLIVTCIGVRGRAVFTRLILAFKSDIALFVVARLSGCTQEHCSRRFAISSIDAFSCTSSTHLRNSFPCFVGVQAPMMTLSSECLYMLVFIRSCPTFEHRYSQSKVEMLSDRISCFTDWISIISDMFPPQWQINTPICSLERLIGLYLNVFGI